MAFLKHIYNLETISIYELGERTVIGRHADCNIHIEDGTVSAHHAQIEYCGESWVLSDLGSTNGILVNGERIKQLDLAPGETFSLGTHSFEFLLELPSALEQTLKIKKSWIPGVYYTE